MEAAFVAALQDMTPGAWGIWIFGTIISAGWLLKALGEWRAWRKLSLEEKQANREGFTAQVQLLAGQVKEQLGRLSALQKRYDKLQGDHDAYRESCRLETDQLRDQIVALEREIDGLKRQRATASVAAVHDLDPARAPLAAESAERVPLYLRPPPEDGASQA